MANLCTRTSGKVRDIPTTSHTEFTLTFLVVYVSLVKAVDDHSIDRYAIAKFIYQAVSSSEGNPAAFVKLLARLVKERDCDYVFLILEEVERLAVADGKDEFLLSMIYNERPLVRCFYPACSSK